LADRLVPSTEGFDTDATLLLLAYAATSPNTELPLDTIATALTHLGWQSDDGTQIAGYDVYRLRALEILRNISHARPGGPVVAESAPKRHSSHGQPCEQPNSATRRGDARGLLPQRRDHRIA